MTKPKNFEPIASRAIARLTADESPLRARGVALVIDTLLDQRVDSLVDTTSLCEWICAASADANTKRSIERHLRPALERHVSRCEASGERAGDAVPAEVRRRVTKLLTEHRPPKAGWAKDLVDPKLVRQLLAPVLQQMLLNFAKSLPLPGLGGLSGGAGGSGGAAKSIFGIGDRLKATVEKHTERVVEAGRSMLGGLSAEVERQVQAAARDFSESASRELRAAVDDRLRSEEGRRLIGQIVAQFLDGVWRTPLSEMNKDVSGLPWDEIWPLLPLISEHNRTRDPVQAAIRDELDALLVAVGASTVGHLLEEAGLLAVTRAALLSQADPVAVAIVSSDGFRGWLTDLLAD